MSAILKILRKTLSVARRIRFAAELEFLRPLPLSWVIRWLRFIARLQFIIRRRAIESNQKPWPQQTTSAERRREALERYTNFFVARYLAHLLMSRDPAKYESLIDVEGWEHVEEALQRGKGAVLLTSHVGFLRLLRWYLRSQDHPACHIYTMGVPRSPSNLKERFQLWMRKRHCLDEEGLVGNEDSSVQYMKRAYECLRQNGFVNVSGDGHVGDRRIKVPMLGHLVSFPTGGISLGLMTGAAILPCFADLGPGTRLRLQIQPPLACAAGLPRAQQLESLATLYGTRLGDYIVRFPTHVQQRNYVRLLHARTARSKPQAA